MRNACRECPFRAGSNIAYDADALNALDDGNDPACHKLVGVDEIFHRTNDHNMCRGYVKWLDDVPGYQRPQLHQEPTND